MAEIKQVLMPDIGDSKDVPVIEIMVKAGDTVKAEQSLLTLETDKATMDVPAPFDGVVKNVSVKVGDKVSEGTLILLMETSATETSDTVSPTTTPAPEKEAANPAVAPPVIVPIAAPATPTVAPAGLPSNHTGKAHASPSIRHFARELGVDLTRVKGSGEKGRITKHDVQSFVKTALAQPQGGTGGGGLQVSAMPVVDFSKFGVIETQPLSRVEKLTGANLHRNWVSIPHITRRARTAG